MALVLWLLIILLILGLLWGVLVALYAASQGDPLTLREFGWHVLTWPYQLAILLKR